MQVSHSKIETFVKCPYQFKLRYKDKLETYFDGDPANPLIIGTALHTGIEKDTQTAIAEYYANYPVITDKNVEEAIKLESVIQKCRDVLPPLDNALFETKIECDEFIGFIDLLVPVGENEYDMYDFKYSNNIKNYKESGQLHEYKFYFEKLNPTKHIRDMYFLFAPKVGIRMKYKNKTNKRNETVSEFRKRLKNELENKEATLLKIPYESEKVVTFLRNAKECRMATSFPKNPTRLCDWCSYQKYCESNEMEDIDIMNLPKNERRTLTKDSFKKIWLYGMPFSGKTYLSDEAPDVLMLNTDGNYKYVTAPVLPIKDEVTVEGRITKRKYAWEVFKEAVEELEKANNDYKTIVVDLLEDVYDACRLKTCIDNGWEHESDDSFKAYDIVRSEFLRTLKRLLALDYNIILISHEDTSKDITKKTGDKVTSIKPNINDKIANKVAGMVDVVARCINNDGKYITSFKTNDVVFGGGRITIDEKEIPSSWDNLCEVYEKANSGKKAAPATKRTSKKSEKEDDEVKEPETTNAAPTDVETADAPPKRKSRAKKTETPVEEPVEEEQSVEEAAEPVEEEKPARRRRRRSAE